VGVGKLDVPLINVKTLESHVSISELEYTSLLIVEICGSETLPSLAHVMA
jgi:hypothetical protein